MQFKIITSTCIEKNKKFLILKRSKNDTMPGLWEFPGGKIVIGEKLKESAKREVFEETGLTIKNIEYIGYSERFSEDRNVKSGYHTLVHHFYCSSFKNDLKISEEHEKFKWSTEKEILSMKIGREIGTDTINFFNLRNK